MAVRLLALVAALLAALSALSGGVALAAPSDHSGKGNRGHQQPQPVTTPALGPPGTIKFGIQPATAKGPTGQTNLIYTNVVPGTTIRGYVAVTSNTAFPVTLAVYAADAVNASTGAISVLPFGAKSTGLGAWLALDRSSVNLPAHSEETVPYVLTIPASATPGDHFGGVVAQLTAVSTSTRGRGKVVFNHRIGFPVFLSVNGPAHPQLAVENLTMDYNGTLNPVSSGTVKVAYSVMNQGNIAVAARQALSITSIFGTLASTTPKPIKDLLPGQTLRFTDEFTGVPPAGPIDAHATLLTLSRPAGTSAYSDLKLIPAPAEVHASTGTWAVPWSQLALFIILILLIWAILRFRRRRTSRLEKAVAAAREEGRRQEKAAREQKILVGAGDGEHELSSEGERGGTAPVPRDGSDDP